MLLILLIIILIYLFIYWRRSKIRGFAGFEGFAVANSANCQYYGSDRPKGWKCPNDFPVYSGATIGNQSQKLTCNGGSAKGAKCRSISGYGAKATSFISSGTVTSVRITNSGHNYTNPPTVIFKSSDSGSGAKARAIVSNGQVSGIIILNGGRDYQTEPTVQFKPKDGGGYGARAEAVVKDGKIVQIDVVDSGNNYKLKPKIEFTCGAGSGAQAVAKVKNGSLVSIRVIKSGMEYSEAHPPQIQIIPQIDSACNYCHLCCKEEKKKSSVTDFTKNDKLDQIIDQIKNLQKWPQVDSLRENTPTTDRKRLDKMLPSEDDLEEQQQIEEKSREYEQMLKERQKINKDKVKKAKAKLKSIQNAQKIEKKMAKEAKKFGLPPPPSLYTQEDIDRANQELKSVTTLPNLTTEQKAECMTLLNEALDLRDRAEELGRLAQNVPGMTSRTREAADKADKAMDKYEKTCTQ